MKKSKNDVLYGPNTELLDTKSLSSITLKHQ